MPHEDPVNWQPIREMPLIARMIDDALDDSNWGRSPGEVVALRARA